MSISGDILLRMKQMITNWIRKLKKNELTSLWKVATWFVYLYMVICYGYVRFAEGIRIQIIVNRRKIDD